MTLAGSTASRTRSQATDSDGEWESLTEDASDALVQKMESLEIEQQVSVDMLSSGDFPQDEETKTIKTAVRRPCFKDAEGEMRFKDALIQELQKSNHELRLKLAKAENKIVELKLRIQTHCECCCKTVEVGEDFADCHGRQTYYGNPVSDYYCGLGSNPRVTSRRGNRNSSESLARAFDESQLVTKKVEEKFVPFVKVKKWQNGSENSSSTNFDDTDELGKITGLSVKSRINSRTSSKERTRAVFHQFSQSEYESNPPCGLTSTCFRENKAPKQNEQLLFHRDIPVRSSRHVVTPYMEITEDRNSSSYETVTGVPRPVDSFVPTLQVNQSSCPSRFSNTHSQEVQHGFPSDVYSTIKKRPVFNESARTKPGIGIVGQLLNLPNNRFK